MGPFENDGLSMAVYASLEYLVEKAAIACRITLPWLRQPGMGSRLLSVSRQFKVVFDYFKQDLSQETLEILVSPSKWLRRLDQVG